MIYLIIGPSCSGKTQLVTNSFIADSKDAICYKDMIKITKTTDAYLIGDYTINKKVRGTDRIPRNQLKLIAPQIIKLFDSYPDYDIVAEGVNICWSFVLDALLPYKEHIKFIYLECTKEISLSRNRDIDSKATDAWFKSVYTRTANIFNKYSSEFSTYITDTNRNIDFSAICLDNIELIPYTVASHKRKLF